MGALTAADFAFVWSGLPAMRLLVGQVALTGPHHRLWWPELESSAKEVIMTSPTQELVGRQVYSRDCDKIGEIKGGLRREYVLIRRSFYSKLVAPASAIESSGERLAIPFSSGYVQHAPQVDPKRELSAEDKARLDHFFALKVR